MIINSLILIQIEQRKRLANLLALFLAELRKMLRAVALQALSLAGGGGGVNVGGCAAGV